MEKGFFKNGQDCIPIFTCSYFNCFDKIATEWSKKVS